VTHQLPRAPFSLIDELSCYYDTPAEPNNELFEVQLPELLDYQTLRQAVAGALTAAPRARGRMAAGHPFRRRYTWEFPPAPDVDPLSRTTWSDEQELRAARVAFLATAPPLRTSPPIRLLLASGPDSSCVMLNAHHAAMDGMSCVELLRDIAARYRAIVGDTEPAQPPADLPPAEHLPPPEPLDAPPDRPEPARRRRSWPPRPPVARIAPDRDRSGRPESGQDGFGLRLLLVPEVPRLPGATVNDLLVTALIATIARWNAAHRRPPAPIRITVPVSVREPGLRGAAGNHTRIATVAADPQIARDLPLLLAAVISQTSALRPAARPAAGPATPSPASAGPWGLAPGWCPVGLKRLAVRIALRWLGPIVCDTSMLTNLGNVPEPPWSGPHRRVRMAVAGPARMPRGLCVGAMTADGHLQLTFRYRHALFDEAAGARFVARYVATLDELTSQRGDTRGPAVGAAQHPRLPGRQG